jgi:ABC-type multidrug transport system fused ATPase/permease subunit
LSTIRTCDKIAVLNHGKIQEYGTHDALMNLTNGLYKRMVEQQRDPSEFFIDPEVRQADS